MASNATNKTQFIWGKAVDTELDFYGTYSYTNAFVFRTCPTDSTTTQEVHLIVAGSQYFCGDSTYDKSPLGSIGISKAGGSTAVLNMCIAASTWAYVSMTSE